MDSMQRLRRWVSSCLERGIREGVTFEGKDGLGLGETAAQGGTGEGTSRREQEGEGGNEIEETEVGEEERRGRSRSSSPTDILLLEPDGSPIPPLLSWRPSPRETERLVLALELVVGFM